MIDILMPRNNEEELLAMTKRLGYSSVCLIYALLDDRTMERSKEIGRKLGIIVYSGSFRGSAANRQSDIMLGDVERADTAELIADKKIGALSGFERLKGSDRTHHKASGLDHVLCKMSAEKKKVMVIDFSQILRAKGHSRAVMIGRMKQNIRLCRKYKVRMAVASFASDPLHMRSPHDLASFIDVMGGDGKKTLLNFEEKIKETIKRKSPDYISEGIERVQKPLI